MTERLIEQSEAAVAFETDTAIKQMQAGLAPSGCTECVDCGEAIEPARLEAAPFARRCIQCQQTTERAR